MKVFMGNENAASGMRAFSALVENENQLEFIYTSDEDRALNVIRSSYYGSTPYGDFTEITFTTGEESYQSYVLTDIQSSEQMAIGTTLVNRVQTHLASGSKLTFNPVGTFAYKGSHILANDGYPQTGTFTLFTNFTNGTVSLEANTITYNISSNNIVINTPTGRLASSKVQPVNPYTVNTNNKWTAELNGTFTGQAASGVTAVYSTINGKNFWNFCRH